MKSRYYYRLFYILIVLNLVLNQKLKLKNFNDKVISLLPLTAILYY